jgi:hypothetical protein
MSSTLLPLPGIAAGAGPFRIITSRPGGGGFCRRPTAAEVGLFSAPLAPDSIHDRAVRQHEYGHLALLRQGLHPNEEQTAWIAGQGINDSWIQGALDVFVNAYMAARGNEEIRGLVPWHGELPPFLSRALSAWLYLRCEGADDEQSLRIDLAWRGLLKGADMRLLMDAGLELYGLGAERRALTGERLHQLTRVLQDAFGVPESNPLGLRLCVADKGDPLESYRPAHADWGPLEILDLVPSRSSNPGENFRRTCATQLGGAFKYPHRGILPSGDGRVFGERKSTSGCTILVDCSGSMRISPDDLQSMMRASGRATIALYGSLPASVCKGRLAVVARNGGHAPQENLSDLIGNGNVVDGPALQWLNRRHGARIWISDGQVTGIEDQGAPNLGIEAQSLVTRGRIQVFPSLTKYLNSVRS